MSRMTDSGVCACEYNDIPFSAGIDTDFFSKRFIIDRGAGYFDAVMRIDIPDEAGAVKTSLGIGRGIDIGEAKEFFREGYYTIDLGKNRQSQKRSRPFGPCGKDRVYWLK